MSEEKKKFRDTKVGEWLKTASPKILGIVGDLLPDQGMLGVVKNLIDGDKDLTPEQKAEATAQLNRMIELENADRASARNREIEIAKLKGTDYMFNITGVIGLGVFVFIVYAIIFLQIPKDNQEVWIHLIGICEGIVISIFGYFYGSAVKKNIGEK